MFYVRILIMALQIRIEEQYEVRNVVPELMNFSSIKKFL